MNKEYKIVETVHSFGDYEVKKYIVCKIFRLWPFNKFFKLEYYRTDSLEKAKEFKKKVEQFNNANHQLLEKVIE